MAESDYVMVGLATAESGGSYEADSYERLLSYQVSPSSSAAKRFTGLYGWDFTGATLGLGFIKRTTVLPVTARVGFWLRYNGVFNQTSAQQAIITVEGWRNAANIELLKLYMDFTLRRITLSIYDTGLETWVDIDHTPHLYAMCGSTEEWKHIGVVLNYQDDWIALFANGRLIKTFTGVGGIPTQDIFIMRSYGTGNYFAVDGAYLEHSPFSEAAAAPPARRFYPALPNAVGDASDWTPSGVFASQNYNYVDDAGAPDDDGTFVSAEEDALLDMYQFASVTLPVNEAPLSAVLQIYCQRSAGRGSRDVSIAFAAKGAFNAGYGSVKPIVYPVLQAADWTVIFDRFLQTPDLDDWTEVVFNGGQFGYESNGIEV